MDDDTARSQVLDAADQLFNDHGVRAVGMDRIRDASGVSLKRLYRLFPAKEQLVEAMLRRRDREFQQALTARIADLPTAREQLLAVFDFLYDWFREPDYRGCPFINAFAEMSATSRDITTAVEDQKHALKALLSRLAAAAGGPPALAEQLFVLANGAMVAAAILHSPEPARQAKQAAALLLDAETAA
jgi:AcrR family transcriptional regulator